MNIRFQQIGSHPIYHLDFDTQYELTMTFLRFQEYYESPEFTGKNFDLEEYIQWYVKTFGDFTYYKDWKGFNLPLPSMIEAANRFVILLNKEKFLLDFIHQNLGWKQNGYIIGTFGGKQDVLDHEIAHGLFYCNEEYRNKAITIIGKYNVDDFRVWLLDEGYAPKVFNDEIQAYALTGFDLTYKPSQQMLWLVQELKENVGHYLEIENV